MTPAKLKSLAPLLALIPLIAFAATQAQPPAAADTSATSPQSATPQTYSEYRNARWHFSIVVPSNLTVGTYETPGGLGQTMQFSDATADDLFQITAEPYTDLDVALGEEATAGNTSDQPSTLGIVHAFRNDLFEITFVKNGISYVVQTLPERATSTLDILKTWEFI
jgi:hypothetical protein